MSDSDNTKNPHQKVWELLPWVINGRASAAERATVMAHLRDCADCRGEYEFQSRIAGDMAQDRAVRPDPAPGFVRLLNRIDQAAKAAPSRGGKTAGSVRGRRAAWLTYALSAVVILQAGGLAILGAQLFSPTQASQAPAYRTLSSPEPDVLRATIRIVPSAGLSVGELGAVLSGLQLQIVGGPSEAGVFSLAPAVAQSPAQALEHASTQLQRPEQLARLRATPGVRFAEPVGGAGSP